MKKTIIILLILSVIIAASCTGSQVQPEIWEGFTGDKMRVIISEFFMPDEKNPAALPEELIRERVLQRASLLLASYINIKLPRDKVSRETDILFNRLISESLASPVRISGVCSESSYCTVITEFDITSVNRELEK